MKIEIQVQVVEKNEKLFKFERVFFNWLEAEWFAVGNLKVVRDGRLLIHAPIEEYGGPMSCTYFTGLGLLSLTGPYASNALRPANFQAGDMLIIEVKEDLDLAKLLAERAKSSNYLRVIEERRG